MKKILLYTLIGILFFAGTSFGIHKFYVSIYQINYAQEKYALGIGMVYKTFLHKEYQPNNGGYVADGSYGVTYTMIEHN